MRHVRLFLVTKEVHMSSAELSSNRWLPQLREHLKRERYSAKAAKRYVAVVDAFLRFLKSRRVAVESAETKHIAQYLQHALRLYRRHNGRSPKSFDPSKPFYWWRHSHTTAIKMLLRLVHGQRVPVPTPRTSTELFHREVCQQYERWMHDVRGLVPETMRGRSAEARRFLFWLGERGNRQQLACITTSDIDKYQMRQPSSQRRVTLKRRATELRCFLRFLYATGRIPCDLAASVVSPTVYAFENIPSALRPEEVVAILKAAHKDHSPRGRRDYAILMLLATYGLRAGEVTSLRLANIDWRNERLRIRHSKTGGHLELPLFPWVGNAILDYLQKGRPKTEAREVFIRTCAPYRRLRNGSVLHRILHKRLVAAGVSPQGKRGPHAFRHAIAVSMLRAAVPAKEIGDVLGHRSAASTTPYLKLATEDLRCVALEIPAEVQA